MQKVWNILPKCLVAWLILFPVLLVPAIFVLVLLLWRTVVDKLILIVHPGWFPIRPPDVSHAARLHSEFETSKSPKKCSGNIALLITVNERVSIEELRQTVKERLLDVQCEDKSYAQGWKHWKLRMVPKSFLGYVYWAPAATDLTKHVWEHTDDGLSKGKTFENFGIDWIAKGFDGRPLWEVILSRPETGKFSGKTVILAKINHVIGVSH